MEKQKRAWIYGHIDAPEDTQESLNKQYDLLNVYANQNGFKVVGYADDLGCSLLWERVGFKRLVSAIKEKRVDVLLVTDTAVLSRSQAQLAMCCKLIKPYGVEIYSYAEGRVSL